MNREDKPDEVECSHEFICWDRLPYRICKYCRESENDLKEIERAALLIKDAVHLGSFKAGVRYGREGMKPLIEKAWLDGGQVERVKIKTKNYGRPKFLEWEKFKQENNL
jgi:hypothetical protein